MKKQLLLLAAPTLLLAGCVTEVKYNPFYVPQYVPSEQETNPEQEEDEDLQTTYNFYFSYSHSTKYNVLTGKDEDCPIFSVKHSMLKPLGTIPTEVDSEAKVKALGLQKGFTVDPHFTTFLGFSYHGVTVVLADENNNDKLWNFAEDYMQQAVVNLYAVWVN